MTLSRRTFLAAGATLTAMGCGGAIRLAGVVDGGSLTLPRTAAEPVWAGGKAAVVTAGPETGAILLWPLANGGLRAFDATCTHLGCDVRPSGDFAVCPCHGSTFADDGRVVRGPAQRPLSAYPVVVTDDTIEIQLPSERTTRR